MYPSQGQEQIPSIYQQLQQQPQYQQQQYQPPQTQQTPIGTSSPTEEEEANQQKMLSQIESQLDQNQMQNQDPLGEITNMFFTLLKNLLQKGGRTMLELIGGFLGVSVDTDDPDQLMDEFNKKLSDPETQLKFLIFIKGLILVVTPPLQLAISESVTIFSEMFEKFANNAVQIGLNLIGTVPGIGEVLEAIRAFLNGVRMVIAGANAAVRVGEVGFQTINDVTSNIQNLDKATMTLLDASETAKIQEQNQKALQQGGLRTSRKHFQKLKRLQMNTVNRITHALKKFRGRSTRKKIPISSMMRNKPNLLPSTKKLR